MYRNTKKGNAETVERECVCVRVRERGAIVRVREEQTVCCWRKKSSRAKKER